MSVYLRPPNLDEALRTLSAGPHRIIAGGTDVYPTDAAAVGWGQPGLDHPDATPILDITAIGALAGIRRFPDRIEIGALATWTEAIESDLPAWFDCVRLAAREIGGRQIQNRGTLAGNLCNASPAADGVPALLALNARVRLQHLGGSREIPLEGFITGNRRTCLQPRELMTAIVIPVPGDRGTLHLSQARRAALSGNLHRDGRGLPVHPGRTHSRRPARRRRVLGGRAASHRSGGTPRGRVAGRRAGHGARG